jgi:uncharacterized membrane protein
VIRDAALRAFAAATSLEAVFVLSGLVLLVIGLATFPDRANPRRLWTGLFWILLGAAFALGSVLPAWVTGLVVLAMVAIDGFGLVRQGEYGEPPHEAKVRSADRLGAWIFLPALMIPLLTYGLSLLPWGAGIDTNRLVYVPLGYASIAAAVVALAITRARPRELLDEGRRLSDAIGAVVILPQLLASLGTVFKVAGVGDVIAGIAAAVLPTGSLFAVVVACCATVAAFTFVMGNSFAAFPVIMAGLGVPLLLTPYGADPAAVGLLVLTCASCGTLCTPMAANFNMVPPALFEMRYQYGVIKFQAPFAAAMFVVHVILLWASIGWVQYVP